MDIAECTRAVLDLFDIDVVGHALHTLDEVVVVVDGVNLIGLGIGGVDVAVAHHADASSFVHQYFPHLAEVCSS